jgi:nitroreductase
MDAIECMMTRRSIRKFTSDPVSEKDLNVILEAVRFAPSWANTQCVELILIREEALKHSLRETLSAGNPAREGLLQAPVVIALCAKRNRAGAKKGSFATQYGDWYMFDAGIGAQNLCLAAHALGYGTVHVGLFDHTAAGKILGLPEDVALLELIPLGRPAVHPEAPARRSLAEWVHQNRY